MNEEQDKFMDRVHLIASAILFGGAWFGLIFLLDSKGVSEEWQRFWSGGLISYLICLFVLRKEMRFKRQRSRFKSQIMHYLFVFVALLFPVVSLALYFSLKEELMPLDIKIYGFGGGGLAVISSVVIGEIINKKPALNQ